MDTDVAVLKSETEQQYFMKMLSEIASNPAVDVEKMRAVIDMKVGLFNRNAEIAFNQSMALVQSEIKTVIKTHKNKETQSSYAKLEDIIRVLSPVWTAHGFSLSFGASTPSQPGLYCLTCLVAHSSGHSRKEMIELPADGTGIKGSVNKTGVHAFGSTVTYARRYLTCMIFNIPVGDDNDGNDARAKQTNNSQRYITESQIKQINDACIVSGVETLYVLKKAQISSLSEIPCERFDGVMNHLKKLAQKQQPTED